MDGCIAHQGRSLACAQIFGLIDLVVEAVEHESHQIRHNGFRSLVFQKVDQVVVGRRRVFDQDLAHDAYPGLPLLIDGDPVEFADHFPAETIDHGNVDAPHFDQEAGASLQPFLMDSFHGALVLFVGPHAVDAFHHDVAEDQAHRTAGEGLEADLEAGVFLQAGQIGRDDRDLFQACLGQGPADEAHIVGGSAAAAGLGHEDSHLVQVIFARIQGFHDLSHHEEGRIAGVVVDVFQTVIHGLAVVVGKNDHLVAAAAESRLQHIEVDR